MLVTMLLKYSDVQPVKMKKSWKSQRGGCGQFKNAEIVWRRRRRRRGSTCDVSRSTVHVTYVLRDYSLTSSGPCGVSSVSKPKTRKLRAGISPSGLRRKWMERVWYQVLRTLYGACCLLAVRGVSGVLSLYLTQARSFANLKFLGPS